MTEATSRSPRFAEVSCSQCGGTFGPRDSGYSHCSDHRRDYYNAIRLDPARWAKAPAKFKREAIIYERTQLLVDLRGVTS